MWGLNKLSKAFYSTSEKPAYDCAEGEGLGPVLTDDNAHDMVDRHHQQVNQLHNDPSWELIESFQDPDGLDMKLFTRGQAGNFHFVKTTFSLPNVTASQFMDVVGSSKLAVRQKFSADCVGLDKKDEPTTMSELVHATYWAPPPVAGRDFSFLVGRRENSDGSFDLWGCSVVSDRIKMQDGMTLVRGSSLWGWRLIEVGTTLMVLYANCFDPRGWTPGFLLSWVKTTAAKEFRAIRAVLTNQSIKVEKTDLADVGISEADVQAALAAKEGEKK